MKPLVRWTIGNIQDIGVVLLKLSISKFQQLYGDCFDYVICYNNLKKHQFKEIEKLNILLYQQTGKELDINGDNHPAWKLYPPRFRPESHELFIDNDLILIKKLPQIDSFLKGNHCIVTEGHTRNFGRFDGLIPDNIKINTGLFGLPPDFDLKSKINKIMLLKNITKWQNYYDEQGLLAAIFAQTNTEIIPTTDISVNKDQLFPARFGHHFVGINRGETKAWDQWKAQCLRI